MEDLISRQAVLELVADYDLSMGQVVKGIHALPPVTPQPKTGHWIGLEKWLDLGDRVKCSKCDQIFVVGDKISRKYCPNCGARMVEPQERS